MPLKVLAYLLLRIHLGFQLVQPVCLGYQEGVAYVLGMHAEDTLQDAVVDERPCKDSPEGQSEVLYLANGQWQSRREVP